MEDYKEKVSLEDLEEGRLYLVKLKTHEFFVGPIRKKQELLTYIAKRRWKQEDLDIKVAEFPYEYLYK